ncbi:hypothetical protein ACOSQ2_007074 [Xanthoceras sorbifolium]
MPHSSLNLTLVVYLSNQLEVQPSNLYLQSSKVAIPAPSVHLMQTSFLYPVNQSFGVIILHMAMHLGT